MTGGALYYATVVAPMVYVLALEDDQFTTYQTRRSVDNRDLVSNPGDQATIRQAMAEGLLSETGQFQYRDVKAVQWGNHGELRVIAAGGDAASTLFAAGRNGGEQAAGLGALIGGKVNPSVEPTKRIGYPEWQPLASKMGLVAALVAIVTAGSFFSEPVSGVRTATGFAGLPLWFVLTVGAALLCLSFGLLLLLQTHDDYTVVSASHKYSLRQKWTVYLGWAALVVSLVCWVVVAVAIFVDYQNNFA